MFRTLYFIFIIMLAGLVIGSATLIYLINFYHKDLPDYRQLEEYNPPVTSRLYSRDGIILAEFSNENRQFVPFEKIPKQLANAFIAAEDQNFYSHPGIDYTSVIRVIFQNLLNIAQNKSLVGGSTITQQVVKNFLLSNERSISRKIREAILAFRISQVYSKDRILELYLNQIYLGNSAYGVAAAARAYFDKSLDDLTIAECAYLAGLPKAPSTYNPNNNYDRAKARRDYVIDRMYEEKMLNDNQAKEAINSKIILKSPSKRGQLKAEYFIEETRRFLIEKFGEKQLYEGGLNVVSTIDTNIQQIVDKALKNALLEYDSKRGYRKSIANINIENWQKELKKIPKVLVNTDWDLAVITKLEDNKLYFKSLPNKSGNIAITDSKWLKNDLHSFKQVLNVGDVIYVENKDNKYIIRQIPEVSGGIIAIDPKTGKILAMSGGFDFGISQFNRVTQAQRQPGSTFKPFVYLSALEQGILPNQIFTDGPIEIYQGPGLPMWKPKNYKGDFLGPITLRTALEKSRNTVTVRLSQLVGMNKVSDLARRFLINDNPTKNLATVLGSNETTLHNLTRAYTVIANYGLEVETSFIENITTSSGEPLLDTSKQTCSKCNLEHVSVEEFNLIPYAVNNAKYLTDERTAYQMHSILEGAVLRGTAQRARSLNHRLFGKTGTSNDSKDVWFIGGNDDIVIGTYIGYDQPKTLGQRVTGATFALPAFIEAMSEILKNYKDSDEYIPDGMNFLNVNIVTGEVTKEKADGKEIIREAFKAGDEPSNNNIENSQIPANNLQKEVFDEDSIY